MESDGGQVRVGAWLVCRVQSHLSPKLALERHGWQRDIQARPMVSEDTRGPRVKGPTQGHTVGLGTRSKSFVNGVFARISKA